MNTRISGHKGELVAVNYLKKKRYKIICTNFVAFGGEIDIIARDKKFLVFVEVKYRKNTDFEYPSEAVDLRKQRKIIQTAKYYLVKNETFSSSCRFDVVEVIGENFETVNHIENAFAEN